MTPKEAQYILTLSSESSDLPFAVPVKEIYLFWIKYK